MKFFAYLIIVTNLLFGGANLTAGYINGDAFNYIAGVFCLVVAALIAFGLSRKVF